MEFKDNLRRLRKEKRITQDDLAKKVEVSRTYIQQLEKGAKDNPSIKLVKNIAKVLEVPVINLIEEE